MREDYNLNSRDNSIPANDVSEQVGLRSKQEKFIPELISVVMIQGVSFIFQRCLTDMRTSYILDEIDHLHEIWS